MLEVCRVGNGRGTGKACVTPKYTSLHVRVENNTSRLTPLDAKHI